MIYLFYLYSTVLGQITSTGMILPKPQKFVKGDNNSLIFVDTCKIAIYINGTKIKS